MSAPGATERLSGANRLVWAAVSLAAILGLCLWRVRIHADTTLADVDSDPRAYAGRVLDLATEAVVVSVDEESFVLRELEREIVVRARIDPADVGRYVHVRGAYHPASDGAAAWIDPVGVRVHRGRRVKIWLSLVPLAWLALLLASSFRLDPWRLAVKLAEHA